MLPLSREAYDNLIKSHLTVYSIRILPGCYLTRHPTIIEKPERANDLVIFVITVSSAEELSRCVLYIFIYRLILLYSISIILSIIYSISRYFDLVFSFPLYRNLGSCCDVHIRTRGISEWGVGWLI